MSALRAAGSVVAVMEEYTEDFAIVADEIEERVEEEETAVYRRHYTVRQRQESTVFYDDEEFSRRFRLSKLCGASSRKKICASPSDVREVWQISVQKLSEVRVCPNSVQTLTIGRYNADW